MGLAVSRLCAAALLLASPAVAQDQRTYLYDAQGRMVGSSRASSAPNVLLGYGFDDADNRLTRYTNLAPRPSTVNQLRPGETLVPGQSLRSPNGLATLLLQTDGNLVLYKPTTPYWSTNTGTGGSLFLTMQTDSNLVLYGPTFQPVWFQLFNQPGTLLSLQDDCNLVLYTSGGTPLWASGTSC